MKKWLIVFALSSASASSAAAAPRAAEPRVDKQHGEQLFRTCAACHHERADATGPDLRGVLGRKAGSVEGFRYSNAMKRANLVWTPDNLRAYLRDPQAVVKGNRMPFPGLAAASDVDDVVTFLQDFR